MPAVGHPPRRRPPGRTARRASSPTSQRRPCGSRRFSQRLCACSASRPPGRRTRAAARQRRPAVRPARRSSRGCCTSSSPDRTGRPGALRAGRGSPGPGRSPAPRRSAASAEDAEHRGREVDGDDPEPRACAKASESRPAPLPRSIRSPGSRNRSSEDRLVGDRQRVVGEVGGLLRRPGDRRRRTPRATGRRPGGNRQAAEAHRARRRQDAAGPAGMQTRRNLPCSGCDADPVPRRSSKVRAVGEAGRQASVDGRRVPAGVQSDDDRLVAEPAGGTRRRGPSAWSGSNEPRRRAGPVVAEVDIAADVVAKLMIPAPTRPRGRPAARRARGRPPCRSRRRSRRTGRRGRSSGRGSPAAGPRRRRRARERKRAVSWLPSRFMSTALTFGW